ncbi:hypothetical protein [Roseateles sp. LYH14W]|uniref:Uncharacterized protein n=1 Tax=Pelomonas parva TaxID=3299032 RepID=A0ABW7F7K7_9BURK
MRQSWKARRVDPDLDPEVEADGLGADLNRSPAVWGTFWSLTFHSVNSWLRSNLPGVRSAIGPHGRRQVRRWFVRRRDFSDLRIEFEVDPFMTFAAPRPWQLANG